MSVFMIILDCLWWIYVFEILPICRDFEIFMMMYIDLMTCIFWRFMTYIRCDCWWILYMDVVWILMWRRSVYFLNIYIIRVYYHFNRNRALHARTQVSWIVQWCVIACLQRTDVRLYVPPTFSTILFLICLRCFRSICTPKKKKRY